MNFGLCLCDPKEHFLGVVADVVDVVAAAAAAAAEAAEVAAAVIDDFVAVVVAVVVAAVVAAAAAADAVDECAVIGIVVVLMNPAVANFPHRNRHIVYAGAYELAFPLFLAVQYLTEPISALGLSGNCCCCWLLNSYH